MDKTLSDNSHYLHMSSSPNNTEPKCVEVKTKDLHVKKVLNEIQNGNGKSVPISNKLYVFQVYLPQPTSSCSIILFAFEFCRMMLEPTFDWLIFTKVQAA